MVSQSDLPDSWSCEADSKHVKVEVQVYDDVYEAVYERDVDPAVDEVEVEVDTSEYTYIEIPTLEVEQIISSTENGGRKRTAEVYFPDEWSSAPVRPLIVGYGSAVAAASYAKVYLRDDADSDWVLKHHGFISGVGGTSVTGQLRMWVYDVSELLEARTAQTKFNLATPQDVYDWLVNESSEVLPLVETDELPYTRGFGQRLEAFIASGVGAFDNYTFLKKFSANRDSLYDVFTWFTEKTGYSWEFLPQENGVSLELFNDREIENKTLRQDDDEIAVINNTALNTINPYNAVSVMGASDDSGADPPEAVGAQGEPTIVGEILGLGLTTVNAEYPTAEAYVPELVESAGGSKLYAVENAAVDGKTKAQAENAAVDRLLNALKDTTEGEIELQGNTDVDLYTELVAEETCSGVGFVDTAPVAYNVENIRHVCSVRDGKPFRTYTQVSVGIDEDDIEVESEMITPND